MKGKVVLAGGTGYIGRALSTSFSAADYELVLLTRHGHTGAIRSATWDGRTLGGWQTELEGATAVVNLSGDSVAKHWSKANRLSMLESRIYSTRVIGEAIAACQAPPSVWVNASAVGYYGDRGTQELTEASDPGAKGHFLVDLCVAWEDEQVRANTPNTRKVRARTGVVLGKGSQTFEPLRKLACFFLGGHVGNGSQYVSWIHIRDLVKLYLWLVETDIEGPVNATSPQPVTNEELMAMLRAVMRRPWAPPVPAFLLKLVSALGGPEASLLLEGQRVLPAAALDRGFQFELGALREAITDLVLGNGSEKRTVNGTAEP